MELEQEVTKPVLNRLSAVGEGILREQLKNDGLKFHDGILAKADLSYLSAKSSCPRYGCTCVNYDRGSGCLAYIF